MKQWEFTNGQTKDKVTLQASEGHEAWKMLRLMIGKKLWDGSYHIPLPHSWSLSRLCGCGRPSRQYQFCSDECAG